jgi:hypothetical protein
VRDQLHLHHRNTRGTPAQEREWAHHGWRIYWIVAREYGLPAVVNVPGILRHIKDGETLTVDGNAATVSRSP